MKIKTIKLNQKVKKCIWEAMRRYLYLGNKERDIGSKFLGLGFETEYNSVKKAELMKDSFSNPVRECAGWYRLTPLGQKVVKQLLRKKIMPKDCHQVDTLGMPDQVKIYI